MTIQLEIKDSKGRAYAKEDAKELGEITFSIAGDSLWIVDHTEVKDEARGEGLGRKILAQIIEHARQNEIKIMPLCPYVKSVFKKEPELNDVLN